MLPDPSRALGKWVGGRQSPNPLRTVELQPIQLILASPSESLALLADLFIAARVELESVQDSSPQISTSHRHIHAMTASMSVLLLVSPSVSAPRETSCVDRAFSVFHRITYFRVIDRRVP